MYDDTCDTLFRLMSCLVKPGALDPEKRGKKPATIKWDNVNAQLSDKNFVIGTEARASLAKLKPDCQRAILLGIRAFLLASINHLQSKPPLQNTMPRNLVYFNPLEEHHLHLHNYSASLLQIITTVWCLRYPWWTVDVASGPWGGWRSAR